MFFIVSIKSMLRRPLITAFFAVLLAAVTVALLVGLTLMFITMRGYKDAEESYTTRVTVSRNVSDSDSVEITYASADSSYAYYGPLSDEYDIKSGLEQYNFSLLSKKDLEPITNSEYIKDSETPVIVPGMSPYLRGYGAYLTQAGSPVYQTTFVAKITGIETITLPIQSGETRIITMVNYETGGIVSGQDYGDSCLLFIDVDEISEDYLPSKKAREIFEIGETYIIKADSFYVFNSDLFEWKPDFEIYIGRDNDDGTSLYSLWNYREKLADAFDFVMYDIFGEKFLTEEQRKFFLSEDVFVQRGNPAERFYGTGTTSKLLSCGVYYVDPDAVIKCKNTEFDKIIVNEAAPISKNQNAAIPWPNSTLSLSLYLSDNPAGNEAFFYNRFSLVKGRFFTEEEERTGAAVIIISSNAAGWSHLDIGDKTVIALSQTNAFDYEYKEFEVVGIFDVVNPVKDRVFYANTGDYNGNPFALDIGGKAVKSKSVEPSIFIYMPTGVAKTVEDFARYVEESPLKDSEGNEAVHTIDFFALLNKNSDLNKFMDALEQDGFDFSKYSVNVEDQGYSHSIQILDTLRTTSAIIVLAAFSTVIVVLAFMMLLFVSRKERDVKVMLALGTKKRSIMLSVMWGLLAIYVFSCAAGLFAGKLVVSDIVESVTAPYYVAEEFPQFEKNPLPLIAPALDTDVPSEVYAVTAATVFTALIIMSFASIHKRLKLEPMEIFAGTER